ncbi:hypothetical protein DFJ74DRAFT_672202 [Hyaloraphidium curvatum]|nr:hypothetical protein DFJ74DRAFT_672202 [Hyaloraphidium curvatum]
MPSAERVNQIAGHIDAEATNGSVAVRGPVSASPTVATPAPGVKMNYLIRRKPTTTRDELIANWFANHMPAVIAGTKAATDAGRVGARRYIATLFDQAEAKGAERPWDGVAQLWWDKEPPSPKEPFGTKPSDTFQEKAEPYSPWATRENIILDGSERLAVVPNTLNAPFPCTRTGFLKVVVMVSGKPGVDYNKFFDHWLNVHSKNVAGVMQQVGGFRYVINLSVRPEEAPFAGMAELYFPDEASYKRQMELIKPDGMENFMSKADFYTCRTEMVGIP